MLRPEEPRGRAVAVFPLLKTTAPVRIGSFLFRSTLDRMGLTEAEEVHVEEIAGMLFLKDDLRIKSASYTMLPPIDLEKPGQTLRELEHVQSVVAYCYSAPHPTSGDVFLSSEHASLAILSPEPVTTFLLRPDNHTEPSSELMLTPDEWHRVPGYYGIYNFREPFWVAKGSRLFRSIPHPTLNISQDLADDLGTRVTQSQKLGLLHGLLRYPMTPASERVLTAISWYNRAHWRPVNEGPDRRKWLS